MSTSFRGWMTALMVAAGALSIGVSTTLLEDRPAVAMLLLLTGTAVLVIARLAWRWMADPTSSRTEQ